MTCKGVGDPETAVAPQIPPRDAPMVLWKLRIMRVMAAIPGEGYQDPYLLLQKDESSVSVTVTDYHCIAFSVYFTVRTIGAKAISVP